MSTHYRYIEWDENNIWKNEIKHGVTAEEIEQCFNNPPFVIFHTRGFRIAEYYWQGPLAGVIFLLCSGTKMMKWLGRFMQGI